MTFKQWMKEVDKRLLYDTGLVSEYLLDLVEYQELFRLGFTPIQVSDLLFLEMQPENDWLW